MKPRIIRTAHDQTGSSLIETMVSLFVLAIGLLGTLAMQTKSVQHNQNSYSYTQAIVLAVDLTERLRTASNVVTVKSKWKEDSVNKRLPGGTAELPNEAAGVQVITLKFAEKNGSEATREIKFKTWF